MNRYEYKEQIKADILEYIKDHKSDLYEYTDREDLHEHLYDTLWTVDSVTGNVSGSYTCNAWQAEEYICHAWDLIEEAYTEFGYPDGLPWRDVGDAERIDVTIRCYLLYECIDEVLDELEEQRE